ncbi:hypothetical protein [Ramlibacter sp. AN1133]|uniref:hypothetical protein n=1 Tax=Ramlibacter sp. AN1133 TaxID=3133429 RepID=UPI0030BF6740
MRSMTSPAARASSLAAWLLAAACLAGLPSRAGEAGAGFRITIQVLPEAPGSCSASTELGAPQLTCRPTVVGSVGSASGGDPRQPAGALYLRSETPVRVAGEMVEVGAENYYAWLESNPIAWSERSSRRVVAGGREYVEMTFSW